MFLLITQTKDNSFRVFIPKVKSLKTVEAPKRLKPGNDFDLIII